MSTSVVSWRTLGGFVATLGLLVFAFGCGPCEDQQKAVEAACKADPDSQACADALEALKACILPTPSPTPSPSPTVEPTPSPTPTPTPTPSPEPTPAAGCPWAFPSNCRREFGAKPAGHGVDSTPWIQCSDSVYCRARGWTDGRSTCAVAPEGNPDRLTCELQFFGGCPTWEYKTPGDATPRPLVDDHGAAMSGDHFGVQSAQDDPQTPTTGDTLATLKGFEGLPKACGLQRDQHGPRAGYFVVAHGLGHVRPCPADAYAEAECGPWVPVDK